MDRRRLSRSPREVRCLELVPQIDPAAAAEFLAELGFLLVPDEPELASPTYLLVAIRPRATERHYDPELVEFWVNEGDRGTAASIDVRTHMPLANDFSWGAIRMVDRFGVHNEYLTFGGRVSAVTKGGMIAIVFFSPVPLLRCGGHSQGWDLVAPNLGEFFGRLRAAVASRSLEAQAAAADPTARYAAFVADFIARHRTNDDLQRIDSVVWEWLRSEEARLRRTNPGAWAGGQALLASTDLLLCGRPARSASAG